MGVDVTTLGMAVDSSGVKEAGTALDDLTKKSSAAETATGGLEKAVLKGSLTAMQLDKAINAVVGTTVDMVKGFFNLAVSLGNYQDLADQVQADPAGLASLQIAADVAGTSVDAMALGMNRLTQQLSRSEDEGKGAGKALASIGIELASFKRLDPAEQYRAIATALEGYADGAEKVAVAQALFGRGGAEQLRAMKELGSEGERSTLITNAMIKAADDFADANARSRGELREVSKAVLVGMIPALSVLRDTTLDAIKGLIGMDRASIALGGNKKVGEFAETAVTYLAYVVDAADGVIRVFKGIGITIAAGIAQADLLMEGEFKKSIAVGKAWQDDMAAILSAPLFSDRVKSKFAEQKASDLARNAEDRGFVPDGFTAGGKARIDFTPLNDKKPAKEKRDEYEELVASLRKKLALEEEESALGRKLTAEEKLRIDVMEQINKSKRDFTVAEFDAIDAMLADIETSAKANAANEKMVKQLEESRKESQQAIEAQRAKAHASEEYAMVVEDELALYGATQSELQNLEAARLRDMAVQLRARKIVEDFNEDAAAYNALLEAQAVALDRAAVARAKLNKQEEKDKKDPMVGARRAVQSYLDDVENAAKSTEDFVGGALGGLEDVLTNVFTGKESGAKAYINAVIREFIRLETVKPMIAALTKGFGSAGSGGSDWFGQALGLFGSFFGGGGGLTVDPNGIGIGTGSAGGSLVDLGLGAGRLGGGDVTAESLTPVNEDGNPELLTQNGKNYLLMGGGQGGTVTPNRKLGGESNNVSITQNISIGAGVSASELAQALEQNRARTKSEISDAMRRGSRSYSA